MGRGRVAALLACAAALACSRVPPMPPAQPVDSVRLVVTGRQPLPSLPYNQRFAYVSPYRHFARMIARDSFVEDARLRQSLRDRIDVPLRALNWRESSEETAAFHVSLLQADRWHTVWIERLAPATATHRTCWTRITQNKIYRGVAVERVADGAIFWRVYSGGMLDQSFVESQLAEDLASFLLGAAPAFPVHPPAATRVGRATMCTDESSSDPPSRLDRPRPTPAQGSAPAPPTRRPPLTHSTIHPEH